MTTTRATNLHQQRHRLPRLSGMSSLLLHRLPPTTYVQLRQEGVCSAKSIIPVLPHQELLRRIHSKKHWRHGTLHIWKPQAIVRPLHDI